MKRIETALGIVSVLTLLSLALSVVSAGIEMSRWGGKWVFVNEFKKGEKR